MYLLLYVLTHSLEVHVCTSLIYTPSCREYTGEELHWHRKNGSECKVGHLAIINDKKKLDLVQSKINSLSTLGNKAFWTGVARWGKYINA